jgi:hypothetical protein
VTDTSASHALKLFLDIASSLEPKSSDFNALRTYARKLQHASKRLGLDVEFPLTDKILEGQSAYLRRITDILDLLRLDLTIDEAEENDTVSFDMEWREKIHTYVSHIRQLVTRVDNLETAIRESILTKLSVFEAEVDRTRTRIQVFNEAFVSLCEGVSRGATALTPAVRLSERIIGAFAQLRRQPEMLALPSPEKLNLPKPEAMDE